MINNGYYHLPRSEQVIRKEKEHAVLFKDEKETENIREMV